jgi:predicted KAP-like P-loop ATPase
MDFKSDKSTELSREDVDKLGTKHFAIELGNAILDYKIKDSLVIGLCGEWGSGKTSILKTTLNYIKKNQSTISETRFRKSFNYLKKLFRKKLNEEENDDPIIIEFNPWNFSDQNQLISQFFKEMIIKLEKTDYDNIKKTTEKLEIYADFSNQ